MNKKLALFCISLVILSFISIITLQARSKRFSVLVVYFSHSGNTRKIARMIHKKVGGRIFRIIPVKKYPSGYHQVLKIAKTEISRKHKPAIKGKLPNLRKYQFIFIGSPNWYSTIAPPVATFLASYSWKGKTVIPFNTHGGGGEARCFTDIKRMVPGARVLKGLATYGGGNTGTDKRISWWLSKIGIR